MSQHSFWAERLFVNKQLSIHIYEKDGKLAECVGIKECDEDPFLSDPSLYERIREKQRIKGEPVVITDDGWVAYIAFEDRNGRIGAFRDRPDYSDTEGQNGRRKLHLTNEIGKLAEDGLKQMEYMLSVMSFFRNWKSAGCRWKCLTISSKNSPILLGGWDELQ